MRLPSLAMVAVAAGLSACAPHMVDPQDAAERMVAGAAIGSAFGTALGAAFSINPVIGAIYGAEAGAAIGGFTGVVTAAPVPAYRSVPIPAQAVIPHFYDAWPPGYHAPPNNPETQQRPAG
jgi:hypothetical protein